MFELVKAGGWLMLPIIACSIIATAIVIERLWTLKKSRVLPKRLVVQIWQWVENGELTDDRILDLRAGSPLGRVLAAGLMNRPRDRRRRFTREVMKESIEETGRHVVHELEHYLNTLGTIAAITPLLGLLGTVIGMIQVFGVITDVGVGDAGQLAGGISKALITTAAGLSVAIPSLIFHRYLRGRVSRLVVSMEQEALKLVEVLHGDREMTDVSEMTAELGEEV